MDARTGPTPIILEPCEASALLAGATDPIVNKIPGIRLLIDELTETPPVITEDKGLAEILKHFVTSLLETEVSYISSLTKNGQPIQAAKRIGFSGGLPAYRSILTKMGESGITFNNDAIHPQHLTVEPWLGDIN